MITNQVRTIVVLALIAFLTISLPRSACSESYDVLVAMVSDSDSSVRIKGKERLVQGIKETILRSELEPEQPTEDTFCYGHFVSPVTLDLAVGISGDPYGGNLIVLSQKNGHYVPVGSVTRLGRIDSIEAVRLFSDDLDQLALNLYGGGSGLRHWAKDIYRWDGKAIRMIWAWVRREIYVDWPPRPQQRDTGRVIQSDITIGNMREDGTREIITTTAIEKGVFDPKGLALEDVTSKSLTTIVHTWDPSLFFYLTNHGRILPPSITVTCREGITSKITPVVLQEGTKIGIVDLPGVLPMNFQGYKAVIDKERFCEVPKSAVELLD